MALPFALSQFISSPQPHVSAALHRVPKYPEHLAGCLVSGPANSGKTSLLFHYACSVAESTGRPVYFLTSAAAAAAGPPLLPATTATASGVEGQAAGANANQTTTDPFDLVQMKYVSTIADVSAFAACLHLLESEEGDEGGARAIPRRPAAVVVDGLSSLPPDEASSSSRSSSDRRAVEHAVLRALAVLSDATAGAWRSKGKGKDERIGGEGGESSSFSSSSSLPPIALVVAEEAAPNGRAPFYLYKRWLPLVLAVRPAAAQQHDSGRLLVGSSSHHQRNLLSLAPLPAAAGGASVAPASASAAALFSFEGAGELEALVVAV